MTPDDLVLTIDGRRPLTPEAVAGVTAVCDAAEDRGGRSRVVVHLSGAPGGDVPEELTVALVSKWERALRRLERLPAITIGVAGGDCGGLALDVLLATDYRVATRSTRLVVPVRAGATWPGMALYRLAQYGANAAPIRRAVLFGTPVTATDALALHLLDELADEPGTVLGERAATVSGSELAIRRQLMSEAATATFEEALGAHLAACDRTLRRGTVEAAS
ncbi:enoyl-CoA-hydratase DpgB [Actinomadura sp. DC4]|uniref:enoyl-CoA-hydratase DpgB n=1 Tax=Actinomadura sp. DC4 TaxID=3055069 RepID=UPI0025B0F409|nr:enoyl-CoA-hydratase DpgB [Actinomadura sp. DC4]MDN3359012.1 enoyl-CoA hydratase/isomerase family protein [Actinomadura sp. DC4]